MAKKICLICGKEMGKMTGKVQCQDGWICSKCFMETGMAKNSADTKALLAVQNMSIEEIAGAQETRPEALEIINSFDPTYDAAPFAKFNDDKRQMILSSKIHKSYKSSNYILFDYDQLVDFELLEDGTSVASGGVGRAIAGGILFGGVGAVVGSVTGKRTEKCQELKVKMTVKDYKDPVFYIDLISFPAEVKKDSSEYATLMKQAQAVVSKLQLIAESESNNAPSSNGTQSKTDVTEELRKFKGLLDNGIITQEEFDAKKKELLGL